MYLFDNVGMVGSRDLLSTDTPLAVRRVCYDATNDLYNIQVRLYNGSGGACVAGAVYKVVFDGDEETNPKVVACTATATLLQNVVVAVNATADTAWDWFIIQGYCDAMVEGTTDVTKDDFLKITAATDADAFIDDTTARTANSFGIACADQTANSAVATRIYLFGQRAVIS